MAKGAWRIRFRIHFAEDINVCAEALKECMHAIEMCCCGRKISVAKIGAGRTSQKMEFNGNALDKIVTFHAEQPGHMHAQTILDDGQSRFSKQSCRIEMITWNRWADGFYPFHEKSAYKIPSFIECLWNPEGREEAVDAEQLCRIIDKAAAPMKIFYAWAGLCYAMPFTKSTKHAEAEAREVLEATLARPHADINDGDDIDYRRHVRGVFWFSYLGPGHVDDLGGKDPHAGRAWTLAPSRVGNKGVFISLGEKALLRPSEDVFRRHAELAEYLKDLFPPANAKPTWHHRYAARLADNRKLSPNRWLQRFTDESFLTSGGFQIKTGK